MNTNEVIMEGVIENKSSNDECKEHPFNVENSTNTSSIIPNCLFPYKEDIQNNVNQASQFTNDCEIILVDTIKVEENSNKKNNTNEQQQKSIEFSNIAQNELPVNSINKSQNINEDLTIEYLKQEGEHIVNNKKTDKVSSLVSIAIEYGNSDSETESNFDETTCKNNQSESLKKIEIQTYRQNKKTSSSEESDSEDDSTSSSDSSVIVESNESDSDDSTNKKRSKENTIQRRKNNEIKDELDDLPPIEDLKISVPEVLCDPLGEVSWMVEQLVVVKPKPDKPTLNLDTVLFVEKGQRALGKIFDVFGQVNEPHYCVRFNSSEHIKESDVKVGMTVYYCPNTEYTSLVFLHELTKIKGIDANADEPPEFSDDEEERAYYEQLKAKQTNNANQTDIPVKRKRTSKHNSSWQSNHPWNRNIRQYNKDEFYPSVDRQLSSIQVENQVQNLWSQPYQNNGEPHGYGAYSLQAMHSINQNFYGSYNYYNENSITSTPSNTRISFNTCPRISPVYLPFQNRSKSYVRFPNTNMLWSQTPQAFVRMKMPWITSPPPPPPPFPPPPPPLPPVAPPSTSSSSDTT